MPSTSHEALVLLFRNRPTLAAELLRDVFHVRLPEFREARIGSADFNEMRIAEYRADLLVEHGLRAGTSTKIARGCILTSFSLR